MIKQYCTYFDENYLNKGLALYKSLKRHAVNFHLFVLCLDDVAFEFLDNMKTSDITCIKLEELENHYPSLKNSKNNRTKIEYYFTCTPALCSYLLEMNEISQLTYLDADLYFFSNPSVLFDEIGESSIAIIPHNFSLGGLRYLKYGKYNVGWVTFKNDQIGKKCVDDWKNDCITWCYDKMEGDKFADQKYLDFWEKKYVNVCIIKNIGANVAPWNIGSHKIEKQDEFVLIDGSKLIFYHFASFKELFENIFTTNIGNYFRRLKKEVKKYIYQPYIEELQDIPNRNSFIKSRVKSEKLGIKLLLRFLIILCLNDLFYYKRVKYNSNKDSVLIYGGFPPPITGQAIVNQQILDIFSSKGINVYKINTFIIQENFSDLFTKRYRIFTSSIILILTLVVTKDVIRNNRPHKVLVCLSSNIWGSVKDLIIINSLKSQRIEIIGYVHNGNYARMLGNIFFRSLCRLFLKDLKYIVFLNDTLTQSTELDFVRNKIKIIENTIDPYIEFTDEELVKKNNSKIKNYKILFLANFLVEKGYWDVIKAIQKVNELKCDHVNLTMVGSWPNKEEQKKMTEYIKKNNLYDTVEIIENVTNRSQIKNILLNSHIMVLPTYYKYEAQPLSIIESLNAGLPIISTKHASIPTMVIDGYNGYLVDKNSPAQIAKKIVLLLSKNQYLDFSHNSRKLYNERFQREIFTRKVISLINDDYLN